MNKDALVIANAICCDKDTYEKADVLIENGVITAVEANIKHNCKRIEAEGFTLMPAFVDLHAHFRDPGYTSKEDIFTGSMAALKGGYTTVNLMANTLPVCNDDHMVERIAKKVKIADLIDVYQSCSITKDFNGVDCNHIDSIESENCRIISDDGNGVESDTVMKKAMELAKKKGLIISSHAEYKELSKVDTRLSENHMTLRDLKLCEETGA
ncbi:MAG: amidohydrolase family protein, partial [Bacteroidota bacterium]